MSKTSTFKKTISISVPSKSEKANPSKNAIQAILNYSKALSVRPSKNIKFVELILN